ncbi:MAG: AAR2 pre-mRNA splicing protein [Candidatus Heimdallarchaeota archaeon]
MYGYIILRDIPKEEAQLDVAIYEIKGGFRGFAEVKPGIHYVTVKDDGRMVDGFWCEVKSNDAVIKRYDYQSKSFVDCESEEELRFKDMAVRGAMNHVLIPVMKRSQSLVQFWLDLTSFLKYENFPFSLDEEEPMTPPTDLSPKKLEEWYLTTFKSRFELAFQDTHDRDMYSFFEELQFAFISYVLFKDEQAYNRYFHLIQAVYNAGERSVTNAPGFFSGFLDIIRKQFNTVKVEDFTPDSKLFANLSNLLEDMEDSGIEPLTEKARNFKEYLDERGIQI